VILSFAPNSPEHNLRPTHTPCTYCP
jgi:hypothetical protein